MPETYYIPPEVAEQGIKSIHQRPFCANEDSIIVGRFNSEYAYANFPKLELNPPHAYAAIILDVDHPSDSGWPFSLLLRHRPGWSLTPGQRPPHAALEAFTSSMD